MSTASQISRLAGAVVTLGAGLTTGSSAPSVAPGSSGAVTILTAVLFCAKNFHRERLMQTLKSKPLEECVSRLLAENCWNALEIDKITALLPTATKGGRGLTMGERKSRWSSRFRRPATARALLCPVMSEAALLTALKASIQLGEHIINGSDEATVLAAENEAVDASTSFFCSQFKDVGVERGKRFWRAARLKLSLQPATSCLQMSEE